MNDVTLVAYDADGNEILEWRNQPADGPQADKAREAFIAATPTAKSREAFGEA